MKNLSFSSGGITLNPPTSTSTLKLTEISPSKTYVLPLRQDLTGVCEPLVKKKASISQGTMVATNGRSHIYSPCSGVVKEVKKDFYHLCGERTGAIVLEMKDEGEEEGFSLGEEGTLGKITRTCLVDNQDGPQLLLTKIQKAQREKVGTIIINGLEEVVLTGAKHYLLTHEPKVVFRGIEVLKDLLGSPRTILALCGEKGHEYEELISLCEGAAIEIAPLKSKYPQHMTPLLVRAILNEDYPVTSSVEEELGIGVFDLLTLYYLARIEEDPSSLFDRIVTVINGDLSRTWVCKVRVGTPISHLLKELEVEVEEVSKVVFNGVLSGKAIPTIDYPITSETYQIFYQTKGQERKFSSNVCIKCGLCVDVCPMNLMPFFISGYAESKHFEFLPKYNIFSCIECGCCTYVCPISIPLVQWIKYGKHNLLKK